MRNDARPIGEAFRDIAGHDRQEKPGRRTDQPGPAEHGKPSSEAFVTNRDPGDEELPENRSDR
jgi:hypothetical protein